MAFDLRNGSREEAVTSDARVFANRGDAMSDFTLKVFGATHYLKGAKELRLPVYGDEQHADFFANVANARGEVIVRKNNVVWTVTVQNCGASTAYACIHGPDAPQITKAQSLAELKKYPPKQKARVGSG